jgi:hypothetical protein
VSLASELAITPSFTYNNINTEKPGVGNSKALRIFGHNDSYVALDGAIGSFGAKNFTVAFWFKTTNFSVQSDLFGNRSTANAGTHLCIRVDTDGIIFTAISQTSIASALCNKHLD